MNLKIKRVYEPPSPDDGVRILVDRLWPRGLNKKDAGIDYWARDVAPSHELRRWYGHDPEKWQEFQSRYLEELRHNAPAVEAMIGRIDNVNMTLLFGARDIHSNNATVIQRFLQNYSPYSERFLD